MKIRCPECGWTGDKRRLELDEWGAALHCPDCYTMYLDKVWKVIKND